ncbi:TlpA family protein disulfide reductase [Streptomyces stramineus]
MRGQDGEQRLGAGDIGAELGERATLVQFSSAFCQPCRATRRVLAEVAAMVEGVAHVEIDAEARLALVRALRVDATPTVLVLDRAGRVVRRAAGQPRKADVIAALGAAVSGRDPSPISPAALDAVWPESSL